MAVSSTCCIYTRPARRCAFAGAICALTLGFWLLAACSTRRDDTQSTADEERAARQTIEAALTLAQPATAVPAGPTPSPTKTPDATATSRAAEEAAVRQAATTATAIAHLAERARATIAFLATATAQATRTERAHATAIQRQLEERIASSVAATATEQARIAERERATASALATLQAQRAAATATEQARTLANERATLSALAALQAQQAAATATEQARTLANERATLSALAALHAQQAAATATEQAFQLTLAAILAEQPTPTPDLAAQLWPRLARARVSNRYPERMERLIDAVTSRLDEFVAPGYGLDTSDMVAALLASGAEDRLNALVDHVWFEWAKDADRLGLDAYWSDPDSPNISPFRKLVIRLVQGTQSRLSEQQAYAFYNYLTRYEEDHVWFDYVQGVIGAINREIFNWAPP